MKYSYIYSFILNRLVGLFFIFLISTFSTFAQNSQDTAALSTIDYLYNRSLNQALNYSIELKSSPYQNNLLGFNEELLLKQAEIYRGLGQFAVADSILLNLGQISIKNTSPEQRARTFLIKSKALHLLHNYTEAVFQLNKAEMLYNELNDDAGLTLVNSQFAKIYLALGSKLKSLEFINLAIDKISIDNEYKAELLLDKISLLLDLDLSAEHFKTLRELDQVYKNEEQLGLRGRLSLAWADYYLSVHDYELALQSLNAAENLLNENDDSRNLYFVYTKKADVFELRQNEYAQKLFLRQALQQADNLGDLSLLYNAQQKIATLFYRLNERDSSNFYINAIIRNSPYAEQRIGAYDLLNASYLDQNEFELGLDIMEKRQALVDSLKSVELNNILISNQIEFDISQYEDEKAKIENELAIQYLEHSNNIWIVRFIIIALALAFIIGFGLYFINRTKHERRNNLLGQKLIYLQLDSHFIFNSLTAIQSLILKNKVVNAEHYLQLFADLMQNVIKLTSRKKIPLHEELSFQMAYLQLQKLRFGDELKYEIDLKDDLDTEAILIPPFLIYPFLEYAIEFCIQKRGAKGLIRIELRKEKNFLLMELIDEGIGFLTPKEAFLKRAIQGEIPVFELAQQRLNNLNTWYKKEYSMELLPLKKQNEIEIRVLQFKVKI